MVLERVRSHRAAGVARMVWLPLLVGCAAAAGGHEPAPCGPVACGSAVSASGTLHVIWNGAATYHLARADGSYVTLLLESAAPEARDALLALDRNRVTIAGSWAAVDTILITSIQPATQP